MQALFAFLIFIKFKNVLVNEAFNSFCRLILSLAGIKTTVTNMATEGSVGDLRQFQLFTKILHSDLRVVETQQIHPNVGVGVRRPVGGLLLGLR